MATTTASLGPGPLRFAPANERPLADQLASLTADQKACFDELKSKWQEHCNKSSKNDDNKVKPFSDDMILRFARNAPGKTKFNAKTAWKVIQKFDVHYAELTAAQLEAQLLSQTLFVVPGLLTKDGQHATFYMRPSRYYPKETSTRTIIDNLAYCMNTMVEAEKECTEGIAFMANMNDWKMKNFSVSYCYQFMMMLQGRIPVRVRLFLIVNPPGWFDKIWNIMKPMLAADFRKKVFMIPQEKLGDFFVDGFETYLPDDVSGLGKASTAEMVQDYVTYRKHVENKE